MSNKETKTRVANAYHAMRAIGIEEDKVKPVLKNLMTLFDKNWALIEEENYKVLADAVYDRCKIEVRVCGEHVDALSYLLLFPVPFYFSIFDLFFLLRMSASVHLYYLK